MKKIIIVAMMSLIFNELSFAQTSKEFISDIPTITVKNKFGLSNAFMRKLNESSYKEIPDHLINLWKNSNMKYVDETGDEDTMKVGFFNECARPIGKIGMRNGFDVILFCRFDDNGNQNFGLLVSFDRNGNILSTEDCYTETFEMTGFFKKNGTTNQLIILTSGEEFVTEDIVTLNSKGLFQTISYKEIENYNFD